MREVVRYPKWNAFMILFFHEGRKTQMYGCDQQEEHLPLISKSYSLSILSGYWLVFLLSQHSFPAVVMSFLLIFSTVTSRAYSEPVISFHYVLSFTIVSYSSKYILLFPDYFYHFIMQHSFLTLFPSVLDIVLRVNSLNYCIGSERFQVMFMPYILIIIQVVFLGYQ